MCENQQIDWAPLASKLFPSSGKGLKIKKTYSKINTDKVQSLNYIKYFTVQY